MFLVHRERSERRDGGTHYLESLKKNTEITLKIVKIFRCAADYELCKIIKKDCGRVTSYVSLKNNFRGSYELLSVCKGGATPVRSVLPIAHNRYLCHVPSPRLAQK